MDVQIERHADALSGPWYSITRGPVRSLSKNQMSVRTIDEIRDLSKALQKFLVEHSNG